MAQVDESRAAEEGRGSRGRNTESEQVDDVVRQRPKENKGQQLSLGENSVDEQLLAAAAAAGDRGGEGGGTTFQMCTHSVAADVPRPCADTQKQAGSVIML